MTSAEQVTRSGGPVVSMTSFGERIATAHLALESIARGTARPSRLILWLDDASTVANPTPGLQRLIARGAEVLQTEDDGPHKKYYPYVQSIPVHRVPLVTADDDWLFPRRWLETLMSVHRTDQSTNTTHRARRIEMHGGIVAPYIDWKRIAAGPPSARHLATGGWGHVMVPKMLEALRDRRSEFRKSAPRADDIWLHRVAVETGTSPKSVGIYDHRQILHMPIGNGPTLASTNVDEAGNDHQVRSAWTSDVLRAITTEPAVSR
ncbi:hypothetical protein BJK06_09890 [Curtobacterium sp. BH-2-1-1]|uniref:hypothetical protein n=1 Tax=Curtobacterium sp. BH-2-1-1 TaxID=1905847 RepID=UPI00089DF3B1|nr:hypothetical protein [Curtobacterium sp. BH-2-1-1]AOX66028.1 hypothetical protein BJK06_09890 [Curtobacterium sp. BH-2-1-1]